MESSLYNFWKIVTYRVQIFYFLCLFLVPVSGFDNRMCKFKADLKLIS